MPVQETHAQPRVQNAESYASSSAVVLSFSFACPTLKTHFLRIDASFARLTQLSWRSRPYPSD